MKKTFTANIAGTVFHIEEDAYEALKRYLENIRANFSGSSAANEIMSDVEARIAELFTERLSGRNVVMLEDVLHVQDIMGKPEDFGDDDTKAGAPGPKPASAAQAAPRRHKRLFRDMDDNWIGGVISGFAAYVGTDPLWIRIVFLVLFFATKGFPFFLIYILMWVLVPVATTAAEKLEMRGEPVTVDNIKRVFEEGAEKVRQGGERVAKEAEELGRKWQGQDFRPRAQAAANGFERFVRGVFGVFGKVVGGFAIFIAAVLAFAMVALLFGHTTHIITDDSWHVTDLARLAYAFFAEKWLVTWGFIGLTVCLLIPVIALMLGGMRLLFGVKVPKMFAWVLTPLWFIAICLVAMIAARGANDVREEEHVTEEMSVPMPADRVLHLAASNDPYFGNEHERFEVDLDLIDIDERTIHYGYAELDVKRSPDTLFHLEVRRSARGVSIKDAISRARAINEEHHLQDGTLFLSPHYSVARDQKLRVQEVRYTVLVPEGASVHFERSSVRLIHNIANTTNTWDPEMVGRTWTMTPEGLAPGVPETPRSPVGPVSEREAVRPRSTTHERLSITSAQHTMPSLIGALHELVHL